MKRKKILFYLILFLASSVPIAVLANTALPDLASMSLERTISDGDETFLQRERTDVEAIVGYTEDRIDPAMHQEEGATLWVEFLSRPHPSVATIKRYFMEASEEFGVPVELLEAIGQVESNWTQYGPTIDQGWGIMHL
ncbi:MAG: hypothetical protein D3905_16555 [Candidatus Electrothrix sp. AS4_5]|nr:hypothetical protein [Candidatus Electrothrix gigas]